MSEAARPVGYLLKRFPRLSETFILNEIRGLERLGFDLRIVSLLQPEEAVVHEAVAEVRASVTYVPPPGLKRKLSFLRAHVALAIAAPGAYLRTLRTAVSWALRPPGLKYGIHQFWRAGYVAAACRRMRIGHLHAHFAHQPATIAALVSEMTGIPYSFTAHAKDLYLSPPEALRKRAARATFVTTCTRYNADYLGSFLQNESAGKLRVIYHGIDVATFSNRASALGADVAAAQDDPLILAVGRLVPKKGYRDLIEACAILRDRGIDFRCAIVGDGPLRDELTERIGRLGLSERVRLEGAMAHEQLVDLYPRAHVFALSPHVTEDGDRDGIPNVLVEAMAAGVPVVSTAVSGIPELIEHGETGLLVPPRDPLAFAGALERLLRDHDLRKTLADRAAQSVSQHFDVWTNVRALSSLLAASP